MNALAKPQENFPMSLPANQSREGIPMTEADYLATEPESDVRREYINGEIHAMTGGSVNHNLLSGNLFSEFHRHLKGKPCAAFINDIKVPLKVSLGSDYVYPDVFVDCSPVDGKGYFSYNPILVVEVLSSSTRKRDLGTKLMRYINLPSLEEYVLVEQDFVQVQVIRKSSGWKPDYYFLDDTVTFESIGLTVSVQDIYDRVDNGDMRAFREQQSASPREDDGSAE